MRLIYTTDIRLTYTEYTADIRPKTDSKIIIIIRILWLPSVWWPRLKFSAYISRMSAVCQPYNKYIGRISAVC